MDDPAWMPGLNWLGIHRTLNHQGGNYRPHTLDRNCWCVATRTIKIQCDIGAAFGYQDNPLGEEAGSSSGGRGNGQLQALADRHRDIS